MSKKSGRKEFIADRSMFFIDQQMGEGGFGKVLTTQFVKNRKWYAIKEIDKFALLQHKTGFSMLYSELNALKRLDHPFVTPLYFAFHNTQCVYFVFDLKTGADLRHYLRKKLLFEEVNVAFYVACISSALHYCHSRNVIHRDVKPENIILDEHGFPHLIDFGVSHVQNYSEYQTSAMASLAAQGERSSTRSTQGQSQSYTMTRSGSNATLTNSLTSNGNTSGVGTSTSAGDKNRAETESRTSSSVGGFRDYSSTSLTTSIETSLNGALTCQLASGTKQYLAPEVFTTKHIHGPEMDYWALGVVAYELLHGKRPFEKHCPREMISYLEKQSEAQQEINNKNLAYASSVGSSGVPWSLHQGSNTAVVAHSVGFGLPRGRLSPVGFVNTSNPYLGSVQDLDYTRISASASGTDSTLSMSGSFINASCSVSNFNCSRIEHSGLPSSVKLPANALAALAKRQAAAAVQQQELASQSGMFANGSVASGASFSPKQRGSPDMLVNPARGGSPTNITSGMASGSGSTENSSSKILAARTSAGLSTTQTGCLSPQHSRAGSFSINSAMSGSPVATASAFATPYGSHQGSRVSSSDRAGQYINNGSGTPPPGCKTSSDDSTEKNSFSGSPQGQGQVKGQGQGKPVGMFPPLPLPGAQAEYLANSDKALHSDAEGSVPAYIGSTNGSWLADIGSGSTPVGHSVNAADSDEGSMGVIPENEEILAIPTDNTSASGMENISRISAATAATVAAFNTLEDEGNVAHTSWCGVESEMGAIFGNHWAIESNPKLTKKNSLKVEVPDYNVWLGNLSKSCVDCIENLLELRPSHRLGGRNIHVLREHLWMQELGLTDWENLKSKAPDCAPHFMPGKSYIQKKYGHAHPLATDAAAHAKLLKNLSSKEDRDKQGNVIASKIHAKQEAQFAEFHYGSPAFDYLVSSPETVPSANGGSIGTLPPFVAGSSAVYNNPSPSGGTSHHLLNSSPSHSSHANRDAAVTIIQSNGMRGQNAAASVAAYALLYPQQSIASQMKRDAERDIPTGAGAGAGAVATANVGGAGGLNGGGSLAVAQGPGQGSSSLQTLAANLKKSSLNNANSFYTGYAPQIRPSTGQQGQGYGAQSYDSRQKSIDNDDETSFSISRHHGGFSSGRGGEAGAIGGAGSGLFKSNGARVNVNGLATNQGPSAGNCLPASCTGGPARKKFGKSSNSIVVAQRR